MCGDAKKNLWWQVIVSLGHINAGECIYRCVRHDFLKLL